MSETVSDAPRSVILQLTQACLALDEVILAGHAAQVAHGNLLRDLADEVLALILADEAYRIPEQVRKALGDPFYQGPLISAALRQDIKSSNDDLMVMFERAGSTDA